MEGETCPLKDIVHLKEKYGAFLFVDEAHSIGSTGRTGKGICEEMGVNPERVDVLMGTFLISRVISFIIIRNFHENIWVNWRIHC